MPPNQLKAIASFTPGTVLIFCRWAIGMTKPSETAWRDTSRSGLASSVPRSNSVRIVARLMIRKSETTRLEMVSSVRRLFRRMFLKISFAYFIEGHLVKNCWPGCKRYERYARAAERFWVIPGNELTIRSTTNMRKREYSAFIVTSNGGRRNRQKL